MRPSGHRWCGERRRPRGDAFGLLAAALHAEFYLRRKPGGHVVAAYREGAGEVVRAAEALLAARLFDAAAAGEDAAAGAKRALAVVR